MRRFAVGVMLVSAPFAIASCWMFAPVQPRRPAAPPAAITKPYTASPPPAAEEEVRRKTTHRRSVNRGPRSAPTPSTAPELGGNANAPTAPSLSLAGEDSARTNTEQLLYRVDRRLEGINRNQLPAGDVATYDQASGFASSAHQALENHDYVMASGLAEKASALAGRLNSGTPR